MGSDGPALKIRRVRPLIPPMSGGAITPSTRGGGRDLKPNRVSIWPVEERGFGIDFSYHGATGYTDAEFAQSLLDAYGLRTSFIQELDGAWTVRFGPLPREQMRQVLDRFAW